MGFPISIFVRPVLKLLSQSREKSEVDWTQCSWRFLYHSWIGNSLPFISPKLNPMLLFTVFYKPKCSSNELLPQGMLEKGLLRTDPSSFSCSNDINPLKFPTYMILSCAHALRVSEVWSRFLSKLHQHHYQLYWQCHTVCGIASW